MSREDDPDDHPPLSEAPFDQRQELEPVGAAVPAAPDPVAAPEPAPEAEHHHERPQGMLPGRERRRSKLERIFVRLVATGGIIGVAVALGAILTSQEVAGWIIGLVIGLTSVILAAVLWSSRQL
jgi:hypothetical protein